ncbi:hypothetical protein [Methylophaga thiooxydans]|uniref:hypothetical protein n=1 Tax=Methylophaga thiooxydans TaxID=392484 RepID=UPI00235356DD|nr:hypothetical protein [Methylophaga thiooxydans]
MKYFKDESANVYAFELDGSQDHLIKPGMTEIDESEIQSVIDSKLTIDDRLTNKQSEIVQKFKQAMSPVTSLYTAEEIASFPTQEPEALAWDADNTAPTPLIDGILAERSSVDKPTLVQRIINNAATYKSVAGPAIGKKQDYEDLLYALKTQHEDPEQDDITKADIDAVVVDFS